jgi:hypothetical protein
MVRDATQNRGQQLPDSGIDSVSRTHPAVANAFSDAPSLGGKLLDGAGTAVGAVNLAAIPLFIGPAVVGGIAKVGAKTKIGWLKRVGEKVGSAMETFTGTTFGQIGEKFGIGKTVGGITQPIANVTGSVAETAGDVTGFSARRRTANLAKASGHLSVLKDEVASLNAAELPSSLRGHVAKMQSAFNVAHIDRFDHEQFAKAHEGFQKTTAELRKNTALDKTTSTALARTEKSLGKIALRTEKMVANRAAVGAYGNVAKSIQSIPGTLSKTSAMHGIVSGGFVAGSALSMVGDARSFKNDLRALKQMYADVTGKDVKKVSAFDVLIGSVPAPLRAARRHMLIYTTVSEIADAIGMGVNIKTMGKNNMSFMSSFLAFQVPDWIQKGTGNVLGDSIIPAYKALTLAHQAGQTISAEEYAQLLLLASPELKARGEHSSFLMEIAKQYADAKASPADILKAASNGEIMARISRLIVANEPKAAVVTETATPEHSHTKRLSEGAKDQRPVLGKFTEKVSNSPTMEQGVSV